KCIWARPFGLDGFFGLVIKFNGWPTDTGPSFRRTLMKRTLLGLVIAAGAIVSAGRAYAHHSFAATYFEDKTQKVEGNLVQFLYRNPHSFVQVDAPDEKGAMRPWS